MTTAKLVLDWRQASTTEQSRRHSIPGVNNAPAGAVCVVWIDPGQQWDPPLQYLATHYRHLDFEVWCSSTETLRQWVRWLDQGGLEVAG